jgi:DNA-binding transcriptional regulator YdaS (Cro superfamily)
LLRAASEIAGGDDALARHLGISHTLLARFISDSTELPDVLLLRAVDIVLGNRSAQFARQVTICPGESRRDS